jgi:hypothetical protein
MLGDYFHCPDCLFHRDLQLGVEKRYGELSFAPDH